MMFFHCSNTAPKPDHDGQTPRLHALRTAKIQTPFAPFVHPKLPLAARLGLCRGARPSRLPFSASRRKPFPKLNGFTSSLIPAFSPRRRRNARQLLENSCAGIGRTVNRKIKNAPRRFLLPGGEGQDEGERSTYFSAWR